MGIGSPVFVQPWAERPDGPAPLAGPFSTTTVEAARLNSRLSYFPSGLILNQFKLEFELPKFVET
jgi:hypothetical protein